jgi:WD40 repeat protein
MQRANLKDYILIYEESAQENAAKNFRVSTSDLANIAWSPDGLLLAAWDSPLSYNVSIYNTNGVCVGSYQAYQGGLGIRCVSWSKDSQLLAVGSYDQVRCSSWRVPIAKKVQHRNTL